MTATTINLQRFVSTSHEFYELCQENPSLEMERTANGEVIIMSPAGSETGRRNSDINGQLWLWNRETQLGYTFDSSTGFNLLNGADRAPDAAWVATEHWDRISTEEKIRFAPIAPDFVIELRSSSDSIKSLREKMQEYVKNGVRMGWLIDAQNRTVEIYEPGEDVEIVSNPDYVAGDPLLPGFKLDMQSIWGD
ncbi:MAG: Uma2 family endonuclease [Caldilineaceae bacterium]